MPLLIPKGDNVYNIEQKHTEHTCHQPAPIPHFEARFQRMIASIPGKN